MFRFDLGEEVTYRHPREHRTGVVRARLTFERKFTKSALEHMTFEARNVFLLFNRVGEWYVTDDGVFNEHDLK